MDVRFWIISTDYRNYALAWSCDPLCTGFRRGNHTTSFDKLIIKVTNYINILLIKFYAEQLWLLGKQTTLPDTVWDTVNSMFFAKGPFKASNLIPVDQKNCPSII